METRQFHIGDAVVNGEYHRVLSFNSDAAMYSSLQETCEPSQSPRTSLFVGIPDS